MIITIDGPTASGKSTVARLVAQELGFYYLYSGLLYRALAYLLIHKKNYTIAMLYTPDETDIALLLDHGDLAYRYTADGLDHILYQGVDITALLKAPEIDKAASVLSTNATVRQALLVLQHVLAASHNIVVDGRDAGSVVFPHADVKFFLTASLPVRAQRWLQAQKKQGREYSLSQAEQVVAERDERDKQRAVAPLIVPHNAIILDNSELTAAQTVRSMVASIQNKKREQ